MVEIRRLAQENSSDVATGGRSSGLPERRNMGRDITKCHPSLQAAFKELAAKCHAQGLIIGLGECFRTVAEQDALYAQGRTEPGI